MSTTKALDTLAGISIGNLTLLAALSVVGVFLVCLIAIAIIMKIVDHIQKRSRLDNTINSFIRSIIKTGLWIISIIIIADKAGIPTTSLVALLSVAGLALSLSLQGTLSNLFSGLTTLTTKPFTSGDFVELDGVSGTVCEVGLFYTTMTSADNKTIYIPNSQVASAKLINYTSQKTRRVDLIFNVSYDVPTESVKSVMMDAIKADKRILGDPEPFVGLQSYKQGSIEYVLRAWVKREDYGNVTNSLNEGMRDLLKERGIDLCGENYNVNLLKH